jgi:tRNA(Ile)-lysidine synthase
MASSKKLPVSNLGLIKATTSKKASLPQQLQAFLIDVFLSKNLVNPKLLLAFSGGLDSCVLLHLLVQVNKTLPFQLSAQHVHHGLSMNADTWASLCADTCQSLNVPLKITKVQVNNQGLGMEAAAREARYNVLVQSDADFVLLAHHQDDQAETFLLQLARGAGVKGLACIAAVSGKLLRPLLDVSRRALLEYAKQHNLTWVEDESNLETKYDRNFIRHEVLPLLARQYPAIRQTISRSAQHMAEANDLLDEIAALDVQSCLQDKMSNDQVLNLLQLKQLSIARIHNALRWWLTKNDCSLPSTAQLQQITQQLFYAKTDATVKIKVSPTHTLQRYRDCAFLLAESNLPPAINLLWQGEEMLRLPDGSHLLFTQVIGQGFALNRVANIKLRIKNREGGERFRPDLGRPSRSLKTILQTCKIPPWQRAQLPLIFMDETLVLIPRVMIPNIGTDCLVDVSFKANVDEMGLVVSWQQ